MQYDHIRVPDGEPITAGLDHTLAVPDRPVIPYIEGDGIGADVTPVMRDVVDAAVTRAYGEADIFAMTSVRHRRSVEGLGLACLEASALGIPVIAHRIGGVEDAVKDGESGMLVEPDDRDALARAIAALLEDDELRRSLGAGGRRWARRFSWETTAARLFDNLAPID